MTELLLALGFIALLMLVGVALRKVSTKTRMEMMEEIEEEIANTPVAIEPEPEILADPVAVEMPHVEEKVKAAPKKRRGRPKKK